MATWDEFRSVEPEMAEVVERLFGGRRHKTLATIRLDGSPRISGIECTFDDGELRFGSMYGSRKSVDLRRDPRCALHSPTDDPIEGAEAAWPGEAKIAGRAIVSGVIEGDGAPPGEMFVVDVTEVVVVRLDEDAARLVVEWWTPDQGRRSVDRS